MRQSRVVPLLLALGLAGCEQDAQELPFAAGEGSTERTVAGAGGTISTAAGASVAFPAGAVDQATAVSLTPVTAPAAALRSGTAASAGFRLEPAGRVLGRPARLEVKLDPAAAASNAWLASVVNVLPGSVQELGNSRVDLSTRVVASRIGALGTVSVVIPGPDAVFRVGAAPSGARLSRASLALAATGTDSVVARCGDPDDRCTGLSVRVSPNLLDRVADAAVVYPRIDGALRAEGGSVAGSLALNASFRAVLASGQTAENVTVDALLTPTAESRLVETDASVTFTHLRHRVSGSGESGSVQDEEVASLVIPKSGAGSVTVTRRFEMENEDGSTEEAEITVAFPVQIHQ